MQNPDGFPRSANRFGSLALALFLIILIRPLLTGMAGIEFLTDLFLAAIFISGIHAARPRKADFWIAMGLAAGSFMLRIADHVTASALPGLLAKFLATLFFVHAVWNILTYVRSVKRVTLDVISAAVCAYLLLGLVFADACFFLETLRPGSFRLAGSDAGGFPDFVYYSFVTLTTLGYGDIVAATQPARSLAMLEAIVGQLYLAVLIGRLVGAYSAEARGGEG